MQNIPPSDRFTTENKKLVPHYGWLTKILQRGKNHTVGGVIVMPLTLRPTGLGSGIDEGPA
jgi:hypothetical protein